MTRPAVPSPVQCVAVRRWKLGHQAFHLLLVTMNAQLDQAVRLLRQGEQERTVAVLDDLTRLYRAATALMRYASDFPREEYETLIRPSMMPPWASPGFSGLANRDHAAMLERLARLRLALREHDCGDTPQVAAAGRRLGAAQKDNRANHMLVCRKFVPDGQSLLRDFFRARHARERTGSAAEGWR